MAASEYSAAPLPSYIEEFHALARASVSMRAALPAAVDLLADAASGRQVDPERLAEAVFVTQQPGCRALLGWPPRSS
jgi:hypothetical protein